MSSDEESPKSKALKASEDLFGSDSDDSGNDTDDLIASAKATVAKKKSGVKKLGSGKKRLSKKGSSKKKQKKSSGADDGDSDDDLDDTFKSTTPKKGLSKKERMEALAAARKSKGSSREDDADREEKRQRRSNKDGTEGADEGYVSNDDSIDSAQIRRTQADDDFIDNEGEDPDAMRELYADQNFEDEPDDNFEDDGKGKSSSSSKSSIRKNKRKQDNPDYISDEEGDGEPSNPILAAVKRMKKKKVVKKKISEIEELAISFLEKMEQAALSDRKSMEERKPGTRRIKMLTEVCNMLAKTEMTQKLLEGDENKGLTLLSVAKMWIEPLPNGQLGNITVRQKLLTAIGNLNGKDGIEPRHLKDSGFGKVVMQLYVHKLETPEMKRQHKNLIETWSRPIFDKSSNMRDRKKIKGRGDSGIVGFARKSAAAAAAASSSVHSNGDGSGGDLSDMLASGMVKGTRAIGNNRVRVPYSKGFQFTIDPGGKMSDSDKSHKRRSMIKEGREGLQKRMIEKNRPVGNGARNNRSANVSIEGRPVK